MFSFFKNISAKEVAVEDQIIDPLENINLDNYSMNFAGADTLLIVETDHTKDGKPERRKEIADTKIIAQVTALLADLPKTGLKMIKMGPTVETSVYAIRDNSVFAYVDFYGGQLKLEDTAFGVGDDDMEAKQAELFSLVKIK